MAKEEKHEKMKEQKEKKEHEEKKEISEKKSKIEEPAKEPEKKESETKIKQEEKKEEVKINTETIKLVLVGLLAVVVLINLAILTNVESQLNNKIEVANELSRPAKLNAVSIYSSECTKCMDVSLAVSAIKEKGFNVTKDEKFDITSADAKNLISKYGIKVIPAVIVTGEIDKANQLEEFMKKTSDAFVFQAIQPPYVDASNGKTLGFVDLIMISDKSCDVCYNVTDHKMILYVNFGVVIGSEKIVDISDEEGKGLLSKYNITSVPTVILSKEASLYPALLPVWPGVGSVEDDGSYVFRNFKAFPGQTYRNLINNSILKS